MFFSAISVAAGIITVASPDMAGSDASLADTLQTAIVVADKGVVVSRTDTISFTQHSSVTDVLLQSSGILIGDNGGEAGLKTVSLRGLGSSHTAIYVDGVRVGNVQSGQPDLSLFDGCQFSNAVVDYAQNSINFTSSRPEFEHGRRIAGLVSLSAGSFLTWKPYGRMDFKLSDRTSLSAYAAGLVSKGDFRYGEGQKRDNNDISRIGTGIDAAGLMDGGTWQAKFHYNGSDRGVPGSLAWPSSDRQSDRNFFIQGHVSQQFSPLYVLAASTKYSFDRIDYQGSYGNSRYDQNEVQVNSAHKFRLTSWLDISIAVDFTWDKLNSTTYDAERYSPTVAVGAAFRTGKFRADAALEYNGAIDKDALSRNTVSPSADIRFTIIKGLDIDAFGRRAYRVPTFNELYYTGYGNPELRPEDAFLSGIGLEMDRVFGHWRLKASADGFLNFLSDKIVSAPSQADPYLWLPYNIGKVLSCGVDISAGMSFSNNGWFTSFFAKYSYQSATDKTPDSSSYGEQIPYVASHSVVVNAQGSFKGWRLEAVWNLRAGRRDSYGEMPDWNTLDITFSKDIGLRGCGPLSLFISGKNLCDCRYESVSGYPMPGISATGGIKFKF